jgi:glyoxylase-like metal-dependent hydrolase (beta-lactamase superfamily II)
MQPYGYSLDVSSRTENPAAGLAQASGNQRLELSDSVDVYFVADGTINLPGAPLYRGAGPETFADHPELLDHAGLLLMSLGAVLIRTADKLVLVDTGLGPVSIDLEPLIGEPGSMSGGALLCNLQALDVRPDDIDAVVITHLHPDHTGWLTTVTDDRHELTFRRAEHFLTQAEWEYWQGSADSGLGPTTAQLQALAAAGPSYLADSGDIVPGVSAMFTPGHTPGHSSIVIRAGERRAIVLGDAIHSPIEIACHDLALRGDVDVEIAQRSRDQLRRELAAPGTVTVGAHFPAPVFGHVERQDGMYRLTGLAFG